MYSKVDQGEDLAQGDIFMDVPTLIPRFGEASVVSEDEGPLPPCDTTAPEFDGQAEFQVLARVSRSPVLLISQSCDAARANNLTIVRIMPIAIIDGGFGEKGLGNQVDTIRKLRDAIGYFYLQEIDDYLGKSVVLFDEMLPIRRQDLLSMRRKRAYRLNTTALMHLQDKLATYYSRYAVDDTYMFSAAELEEYRKSAEKGEAKRAEKEAERDARREPPRV